MSVFSATQHSHRSLDVITVHIISQQGDQIPLQALVVPHIATPLRSNNTRTFSTCLTSKV